MEEIKQFLNNPHKNKDNIVQKIHTINFQTFRMIPILTF